MMNCSSVLSVHTLHIYSNNYYSGHKIDKVSMYGSLGLYCGNCQTVQSCCGLCDPRGLVLGDLWFVLCGLFGTSEVVIQSAA